jgi:hypothetical protein
MREYVSICGLSAAGKKTLIRRLLADEGGLRDRFSVSGPLEAFGYSFEPLDRIHDSSAAFVLHQWQWANDRLIEELVERHPDGRHRIVLLWRPLEEQYRDIQRMYGESWRDTILDLARNWEQGITSRFRHEIPTRLGIEVELVDGSAEGYPRLTDWPVGVGPPGS